MVLTIPDWLAENIAWVIVGTGGVGLGTYFLRRRGGAKLRRNDDEVVQQLITLVKENTAAFKGLDSTMQDNKGITIKVSETLIQVKESLAHLAGRFQSGQEHKMHAHELGD